VQDKWGALIHGRPSLIHLEDWSVKPVEARDFPETAEDDDDEEGSSEIEQGRLTFNHMISLTEILTDILSTFFTLKATTELASEGENAMKITLDRAKPIQLRLKDWHSKLPRSLDVGETKARKLSPTGEYLLLATYRLFSDYLFTRISTSGIFRSRSYPASRDNQVRLEEHRR
jgi:hypothetical protein